METYFNFVFSLLSILFIGASSILFLLFQSSQKKNRLGGPISWAKSFWLFGCIYTYFAIPLSLFLANKWTAQASIFLFWMTARGVFEISMLYLFKKWRPWMGITHNISAIVLILVFISISSFQLLWAPCLFCLTLDSLFASYFSQHVSKNTTGDSPIWFVNHSPNFKKINVATMFANIGLLILLTRFWASL